MTKREAMRLVRAQAAAMVQWGLESDKSWVYRDHLNTVKSEGVRRPPEDVAKIEDAIDLFVKKNGL
jgi:hypothetical protein